VPDPVVTLHEPVLLRLVVENPSPDAVAVDLGVDGAGGLLVTIITPAGAVLHRPVHQPDGLHEGIEAHVDPGGRYVHDVLVDPWYDFDTPGRYGVGVTLRYPILVGARRLAPPAESFHTVMIAPRDEAALKRRCESLAGRLFTDIVDENTVADSLEAIRALSYIRDPVVVPYLVRSLKSTFPIVQGRAVGALARLSTPEALRALVHVATGDSPGARDARTALLQAAHGLRDAELRTWIYDSLREPEPR
jgi:HEAT repeats